LRHGVYAGPMTYFSQHLVVTNLRRFVADFRTCGIGCIRQIENLQKPATLRPICTVNAQKIEHS